jgi:hypothetical protein
LRGVAQTAAQGAKTNVQTTLCDQKEPANASSLYLAVTPSARAFPPFRLYYLTVSPQ